MDHLDKPSHSAPGDTGAYHWSWFAHGAANIISLPAIILMSVFVGYGGIAREAGLTLGQTAFSVPTIWAFPSHLLLVAGISSGASLIAVAFAVTLASIRMMPMTMALIPEIRTPRSRLWQLWAVSNFVAITAWVHTLQRAPELPREGRLPYFIGFAFTLSMASMLVASITFVLSAQFPVLLMASLYFLTPLYFAISIWRSSRYLGEYAALFAGLLLGPVLAMWTSDFNILLAGLLGGLIGYGVHRVQKAQRSEAGS